MGSGEKGKALQARGGGGRGGGVQSRNQDSPRPRLPSLGAAGSAGSAAWGEGWRPGRHSTAGPPAPSTGPGPPAPPAAVGTGPPPPPSSAAPAAARCLPPGPAPSPPSPPAATRHRPETREEGVVGCGCPLWVRRSRPPLPALTCFTCCQDSSHCRIFLLASSSCRRTRASSAPFGLALEEGAGPVFRMGDGLGEKLPETKSQMLPGTLFKPERGGDRRGHQQPR